MDARERVDEEALRRLVDWLLKAGVDGLFVMGTTGEFALLTDEERRRAVSVVVDQASGRVPVLAGAGAESTKKAILHAEAAAEAGADLLVVMPPYYLPATQEEMVVHARAVVRAVDLPALVYNIPWCTSSSIEPATAARMFDLPRVIGMKDSSDDFWQFQRLLRIRNARKDVVLFQGSENHMAASLVMGADGGVPGIGNVMPHLFVEMYQAAKAGNVQRVKQLDEKLQRLRATYTLAPPRQLIKYMMALQGFGSGRVAQPAAPLPVAVKKRVEEIMRQEGFLS